MDTGYLKLHIQYFTLDLIIPVIALKIKIAKKLNHSC